MTKLSLPHARDDFFDADGGGAENSPTNLFCHGGMVPPESPVMRVCIRRIEIVPCMPAKQPTGWLKDRVAPLRVVYDQQNRTSVPIEFPQTSPSPNNSD